MEGYWRNTLRSSGFCMNSIGPSRWERLTRPSDCSIVFGTVS
jgi:hypothetical protein